MFLYFSFLISVCPNNIIFFLFLEGTMSWIRSCFIGNDANIISLLSRNELYPQQTIQETIEITQLHILIVKVLIRCIVIIECEDYDSNRWESLLKILLACLDKINLKDFHMLGKFSLITL